MNHLTKCFCLFFLILSAKIFAEEKKTHEISMEIKISCPMSDGLQEFVNSIPEISSQSVSFEEWKKSFVNSMTQLIKLVENEKIAASFWSAKTDIDSIDRD